MADRCVRPAVRTPGPGGDGSPWDDRALMYARWQTNWLAPPNRR